MGGNWSGVCNNQESKILYEHFTKTKCQGFGFTVQIIQKLNGNGWVSNSIGAVPKKSTTDVVCTALRDKSETDWMVELRSVYPYNLNDRCKGRDWRERGQGELVGATVLKK